MGFFDRFTSKKDNPAPTQPASPAAAPADPTTPLSPELAPAPTPPASTTGGGVKPLLAAAREKLEAKDLAGALSIYEELLRTAGDRPDVLVTISGDLGSCGYVSQIAELIAPRYDAERHGPATGLNLLQAYLATHNTTAAQHLLDILFALQRPELEERLYGFSNALGELLEREHRGELSPVPTTQPGAEPPDSAQPKDRHIGLISISRPIWSYGIETVAGLVPPPKNGRFRRVAFGQLALLGIADLDAKVKEPEDDLVRFTRGFPLWLSETLYFCPHYAPITAIGALGNERLAIFPSEWTIEHIRQLVATATEGLDYVFTGAVKQTHGDYELILRVWEVKKFRERKQFTARWTPATADDELTKLNEQIRLFMEWQPYPAGPAYIAPASPTAWCDTLGLFASAFLVDKNVLPKEMIPTPAESFARLAARATTSERDTIAWLGVRDRATRLGLSDTLPAGVALTETPATLQVREALGLL
jgi:hypothetical protein